MKDTLKNSLLAIGEHFLFALLSLFLAYTFDNLFKNHLWILSTLTALFYVSSCYSAGWTNSKKDFSIAKEDAKHPRKDNSKKKYRIYEGFIIALPNLILGILFLSLALLKGGGWEAFFRFYEYPFIHIITNSKNTLIYQMVILAVVLPYLAYGFGYIMGKDKKVLFVKHIPSIIYKKKDK